MRAVRFDRAGGQITCRKRIGNGQETARCGAISPAYSFCDSRPSVVGSGKSFWAGPDERLLTAYRRLEDIVRKRTGLKESVDLLVRNRCRLCGKEDFAAGAFGSLRVRRGSGFCVTVRIFSDGM
jgi:hypothetical protein